MHIIALEILLSRMTIHLLQTAQIATLQQNEAPTKVPPKYADFANVFSPNLAMKLPENTGIDKHATELEDGK